MGEDEADADRRSHSQNNKHQTPAEFAAIARAKQEWECTVDALTQLVCVLDAEKNIVRANRTIETWFLGRVQEVQGRNIHALFHPRCVQRDCEMSRCLDSCWQIMLERGSSGFELRDPIFGRVLSATLRRMGPDTPGGARAGSSLAVIVFADVTTLQKIQADLQAINEQLETRIEDRTRELNASRDELSMLSAQLMTAQENERKRIAQELHDSIGQSLSAIKYSLERGLDMTPHRTSGMLRRLLETNIQRVQKTLESIRSIAMNLRPSMLDDLGAVSAVRWFCREFTEVYAALHVHLDLKVTDDEVPLALATPIFRTVQESLNNVARHARARNVRVLMRTGAAGLTLEIRDDGIGFDPAEARSATPQGGYGLSGLRERASKTGGQFSLQSRRGCGTTVRVEWPLPRPTGRPFLVASHRGFTLLELLVVMVIIGLLAGLVAPRYFAQVGKSQVKAARAQIDSFDKALDQYRVDMGRFPTTEEGLEGLTTAPPGEPAWGGPYLKRAAPADPWGHPYVYVSPGEHGDVDIMSYGKDGQPGGNGENADVTNW